MQQTCDHAKIVDMEIIMDLIYWEFRHDLELLH